MKDSLNLLYETSSSQSDPAEVRPVAARGDVESVPNLRRQRSRNNSRESNS